eukprot:c38711_g1_i1 orf=2-172(-)
MCELQQEPTIDKSPSHVFLMRNSTLLSQQSTVDIPAGVLVNYASLSFSFLKETCSPD